MTVIEEKLAYESRNGFHYVSENLTKNIMRNITKFSYSTIEMMLLSNIQFKFHITLEINHRHLKVVKFKNKSRID